MEPVIFLELVDRKGNVQERFRLTSFPATIGRGYSNTVILDDRYVSPQHAIIRHDELGALWIEDLASANGLFRDGNRVERVALGSGTRFQLGRTQFRVCTPDQAVEPVLREARPSHGIVSIMSSRAGVLALCGLAVLAIMSNLYLKSYNRVTPFQLLAQSLGIMTIFLVWSGAWALVNRVVAQRFAFGQHLAMASVAVVALLLFQPIAEYLEFLFAPLQVLKWGETVAEALFLAGLLYGHLAIIGTVTRTRRMVFSGAISIVIFSFVALNEYANHGWYNPAAERPAQLKPIGAGLLRTVNMEEFLVRAKRLKAAVDSLADDD